MREKGRSQRDWIGRAGEGSGKGEGERSRWECGRGGVREDPEGGSGWWVPSRGICWRDRPLETEETVDRRFNFAYMMHRSQTVEDMSTKILMEDG